MVTAKTLYVYGPGLANSVTCPVTDMAAVDAAARTGGWYTLPNGYRINWDNVTLYLFQ